MCLEYRGIRSYLALEQAGWYCLKLELQTRGTFNHIFGLAEDCPEFRTTIVIRAERRCVQNREQRL